MKFLRYGEVGREKPGALDEQGRIRDISAHVIDSCGGDIHPDVLATLTRLDLRTLPLVEGTPRSGL